MDDGYIISNDIKELNDFKNKIVELAKKYCINISLKKLKIIKFSNNNYFKFLKFRICLKNTGKVLILLGKKQAQREKTRLKNLFRISKEKKINTEDIFNSIISWIGYSEKYNAFNTTKNIVKCYINLYREYYKNLEIKLATNSNRLKLYKYV